MSTLVALATATTHSRRTCFNTGCGRVVHTSVHLQLEVDGDLAGVTLRLLRGDAQVAPRRMQGVCVGGCELPGVLPVVQDAVELRQGDADVDGGRWDDVAGVEMVVQKLNGGQELDDVRCIFGFGGDGQQVL